MERPSFGKDYILNELDRISVKIASSVNLFVIGGLALIHFGLKEATKDIDVVTQSTTGRQMKTLVADSQYSCMKLRDQVSAHGAKAVIPYPANQRRGEKSLLRVDKHFRTHGPAHERRTYRQRAAVERMNSRLKDQLSLNRHRVRGLRNVTVHALLCIIAVLLTALAALQFRQPEKTRSITFLGS